MTKIGNMFVTWRTFDNYETQQTVACRVSKGILTPCSSQLVPIFRENLREPLDSYSLSRFFRELFKMIVAISGRVTTDCPLRIAADLQGTLNPDTKPTPITIGAKELQLPTHRNHSVVRPIRQSLHLSRNSYFFFMLLNTKSSKNENTCNSSLVLPKSVSEGRLFIKKI